MTYNLFSAQHSIPGFFAKYLAITLFCLISFVATSGEASAPPWATGKSHGEDITISLITFSPGDEIVSWFGHTALVVEDQRLNHARLYNYGMFTFDEKMLINFTMGRLWFWVGEASVMGTFNAYKNNNRDVRIMQLNLPAETRLEMAQFLANNVLPQNREYLYHHYFDNCATRIRDVIDRAVGGQFAEYGKKPGRMTLRDHTRRHAAHHPPMDMLLMFLMNGDIDEPVTIWEEMFLPEELERHVRDFVYIDDHGNQVPLVIDSSIFFQSDRNPVPESPPPRWPMAMLLGLGIGVVGLGLGRWERRSSGRVSRVMHGLYHALIGLMLGFPGAALAIMWLFTEHDVTYWNHNLLLANPLTFMVFPLGLLWAVGVQRIRRWLHFIWLVSLPLLGTAILLLLIGRFTGHIYHETALVMAFIGTIIVSFGYNSYLFRRHHSEQSRTIGS